VSRIVLVPGRWWKRRPWLVGNSGDLDLDLGRERCRVVKAEGVPRAGVSDVVPADEDGEKTAGRADGGAGNGRDAKRVRNLIAAYRVRADQRLGRAHRIAYAGGPVDDRRHIAAADRATSERAT